jgi:hypothetical protein
VVWQAWQRAIDEVHKMSAATRASLQTEEDWAKYLEDAVILQTELIEQSLLVVFNSEIRALKSDSV